MVSKAATKIDMSLGSANCSMIVPSYKYDKGERFDFNAPEIAWKEGNELLLEETISNVMKEKYQAQLANTLTDTLPVIYLDCKTKGESEIMFAIMEKLIEKYSGQATEKIFMKNVLQYSMLEDHIKKGLPTTYGEFIIAYDDAFKEFLLSFEDRENKDTVIKQVKGFELDVALHTIGEILRNNKTNAYMYLDHVSGLTIEEQQNINLLLYTRGAIGTNDGYLYLKINDGLSSRKTRSTANGHRAQATHDYSETSIGEEDL